MRKVNYHEMERFKGTKLHSTWLNDDTVTVDYVCSDLDDELIITAVWYKGIDVQNIINDTDFERLIEEINKFENE